MNRGSIDVVGGPRRRYRNHQPWLKHGLVVVGLLSVGAGFAGAQSFNEYPVPTANSQPWGITAGPDGNIWFTERAANKIGMVTSGGVFTEYPVPTSGSWPYGITAGPDGNLWFVESAGNRIGKLTPSGTFTEYPVPTANSALLDITAGPDGNLWFTESAGNRVGKVTPGGSVTEYALPVANSGPWGITTGPDGNLWFTEISGNRVGTVTVTGTFTEYAVPTDSSSPYGITSGPDGKLWFTEYGAYQVANVTTGGAFNEYIPPSSNSHPRGIAVGSDGNLWFAEEVTHKIAQVTPSGSITEYALPSGANPFHIVAGADGNLWFTDTNANTIGQLVIAPPPAGCPPVPADTCYTAEKNRVVVTSGTNSTKHKFLWKWSRGTAALGGQTDFGDPVNGGTTYTVCVYDQTGSSPVVKLEATIGNDVCGATSCWKAVSTIGWSYKNKAGNSDGITKVTLKGGAILKPKVQVQAKGANLLLPTPMSETRFFAQDPALLVQLYASNPANCWSSYFEAANTKRNDGQRFKATTP